MTIEFALASTGLIVWVFIGAVVAAFVVFCVIPALWREMCFVGYCVFGDRAEKAALKLRANERARVKDALQASETNP